MPLSEKLAIYFKMPNQIATFQFILNIIYTIAVILLFIFIARLVKSAIKRFIKRMPNIKNNGTFSSIISSFGMYITYFLGLFYILGIWGIDATSLIAISGVLSVGLGLGAQEIIKDILAGVFIISENQFAVNDSVDISGYSGTVESIGMRTTCIRGGNGSLHIIPNGQIKAVTNMSKGQGKATIDILISNKEDINKVFGIIQSELDRAFQEGIIAGLVNKPSILGINELNNNSVVIRLTADCNAGDDARIGREIRLLIKKRFDVEGIKMPFEEVLVNLNNG